MRRVTILAAAVALLSPSAFADTLPKRKPGLWEATTTGGPMGPQTIEQCVDAATDDLTGRKDLQGRNCSPPVITRNGSKFRIQFSCEDRGVKSTFDGDYSMPRDTELTGEMKMRFDPPQSGISGMDMKTSGRWVGGCPDGMKPGDVAVKGMPRMGKGMDPEQMRRMAEEMQKNLSRMRQGQPAQ